MSLGIKREGSQTEGIKEPISIQVKANRSGVGHEEEQTEKQRQVCEAHMDRMMKRARMEVCVIFVGENLDSILTKNRVLYIFYFGEYPTLF
ncbi:unnamed protein product [Meloidogyne enterolobii]|uniref:Uncharacterized protein n=1 Tax=Meloidogyne enterolobii TaxID=390850 RepID=A0ACB0Y009_MELEN